jgi:hypothetical protein
MARFAPGRNRFLGAGESGTDGDSMGNELFIRLVDAPALSGRPVRDRFRGGVARGRRRCGADSKCPDFGSHRGLKGVPNIQG